MLSLFVNGFARTADTVAAPGIDQVEITRGSPGFICYTLAPDFTIHAGSEIELKVGNHTSASIPITYTYSTTTGTTTIPGDSPGIVNSATLGTHAVKFEIWDGDWLLMQGSLLLSSIECLLEEWIQLRLSHRIVLMVSRLLR